MLFAHVKSVALNFGIMTVITVCLAIFYQTPVQAGTDLETSLEKAIEANRNLNNLQLQKIVASRPEILLEQDHRNRTLIDEAFLTYNDDGISQTNFVFLEFLFRNDFFGQPVDRKGHFGFALSALREADYQINRIDLSDDMIVHRSRDPFIELLSQTVGARTTQAPFSDLESVSVITDTCDSKSFEIGQEKLFSAQLSEAIKSTLTPLFRNYLAIAIKAQNLDPACVMKILS